MRSRKDSKSRYLAGALVAAGLVGSSAAFLGAVPAVAQDLPAPAGSADRGKAYFLTYKCYSCHGYTGQTGVRRLVPMRWPQEAFAGFVQNSPIPDMPAYRDVPAERLADLYAYIRSIPPDDPDVATLPLLKDIRARASALKP